MTTSTTQIRIRKSGAAEVFGPASRVINPIFVRLAGSPFLPLWAIVRHHGRRSNRDYATPVAVARQGEFLFIPLPFGTRTDWLRNVQAAESAVIRWKGVEHRMVDPVVLDQEAGVAPFNAVERWAFRRLGIAGAVRLRFADRS